MPVSNWLGCIQSSPLPSLLFPYYLTDLTTRWNSRALRLTCGRQFNEPVASSALQPGCSIISKSPGSRTNRMTDLTNRTVKSYQFRAKLGEGGFGAVYQAYQAVADRSVAIETILPAYA